MTVGGTSSVDVCVAPSDMNVDVEAVSFCQFVFVCLEDDADAYIDKRIYLHVP